MLIGEIFRNEPGAGCKLKETNNYVHAARTSDPLFFSVAF